MRKSILRATSHCINFRDNWENLHNSVNFELIFDFFSPCSSKLKDLQLLCRLRTRYSRKFREDALFTAFDIWHATNTEYLDFPIFVFNLTLNLDFMVIFSTNVACPLSKTISCNKLDSNILCNGFSNSNNDFCSFLSVITRYYDGPYTLLETG
jgi:hypothetical protein